MKYFIIWGSTIVYLNYLASGFASKRAKRIPDQPLPDILHEILPRLNNHIPDHLLLLCVIYIFMYRFPVSSSNIIRLLTCLTVRPIFICLTSFPTCYHPVVEKEKTKSIYSKLFLSQHDLMFSGHTCWFIFFGHVIKGMLGKVVQFLFPLTLVAARYHYTIDVVVAMLVYSLTSQYPI